MEKEKKMQEIVDSREMKQIDSWTIAQIGIPSMVLMERAALSVVEEIRKRFAKKEKILCLCGTGNNGGDGVAIARILHQLGYMVHCEIIGEKERCTEETRQQVQIAEKIGVIFVNKVEISEYTVVVDAIFGIGLSRDIQGIYEEVIEKVNKSNSYVIAVDIPSGVCTNTGKIWNVAMKANVTVTFGYWKTGLVLYPGAEYAGEVVVAYVGFVHYKEKKAFQKFFYEKRDLKELLPQRSPYSNKGTYGKILVIAGSKNMCGAAIFSAKAAYVTGAGLVRVVTVEDNREIIQSSVPEVVLETYKETTIEQDMLRIKEHIQQADAIVIGPGLGKGETGKKLLSLVIEYGSAPTVIDADALHLLVREFQFMEPYRKGKKCKWELPANYILTPHMKEMTALLGNNISIGEIRDNLFEILSSCVENKNILVLKDARTVVLQNEQCYINMSGNDGMATAGAGDVLTGIIAGLLGQKMSPYKAATLGVYLHGLAGEKAGIKKGRYSVMAQDILEGISAAMKIVDVDKEG